MFSELIVCYLFLGGAGAGALAVLSLLELLKRSRALAGRVPDDAFLPREVFVRAWPMCFVLLALGVLCLLLDVGRPERILGLVLHPQLSPMTVGSFALVAALLCAGTFSLLALLDNVRFSRVVSMGLAWCGVVAGVVAAAYTGVLLQGLVSVLFWQTPLLLVLFVVSSLSCGVAVVLMASAFAETRRPFLQAVAGLASVDSVLLVIEGSLLAAWLVWAGSDGGTVAAARALAAGDLRWMFWGALVVAGLVIPFAMERFVSYGNYRSQMLWTASLVLAGGFALRFCVAEAGLYDVAQAAGVMVAVDGFGFGW